MKQVIRTSKIEIDTAVQNGPQWISAVIQTLELDANNNVVSTRLLDRRLYRKADQVAAELVTFTDPVTGQQITMSVAGIAAAIKMKMINWMETDNNATYDPSSDLVILNGPSS